MNWSTKLFLVLLQLAIGWHFLYEGLWKIKAEKTWSSRPYLSAANGPTGPAMRWSAGDPAVTREGIDFTVADPTVEVETYFAVKPLDPAVAPVNQRLNKHMPPQLEKEWDAYFADYLKSYGLDKAPAPNQAELEKLQPEFIAVLGADPMAGSVAVIPWAAVEISWVSGAWKFDKEGNPDPRAQRLLAERRLNQMKQRRSTGCSKAREGKRSTSTRRRAPSVSQRVGIPCRRQEGQGARCHQGEHVRAQGDTGAEKSPR